MHRRRRSHRNGDRTDLTWMTDHTYASDIPTLLDDISAGRMVILMDDEDRENEGDLIIAAEKITRRLSTSCHGSLRPYLHADYP